MARKKKEAEQPIEQPVQSVYVPPTVPSYKYKNGDRVTLVGNGNTKNDGTGKMVIKTTGLKYVENIVRGAAFPYKIIISNGKLIGYFKEDALSKI